MADVDRAELIRLMVGREISAIFPEARRADRRGRAGVARPGSRRCGCPRCHAFACARGEILGLAGLVGSGRTELARDALRPDARRSRARSCCAASRCASTSPADAIALGIGYVPEDRRQHGVVLEMPIAANTSLANLRRGFAARPDRRRPRARPRRRLRGAAADQDAVDLRRGGHRSPAAISRRSRWRAGWRSSPRC